MLLGYMILYHLISFIVSIATHDTMNVYLRSVEGLYSYYDSLDQHDLKTLILEEENMRDQLGYQKVTNSALIEYKKSRLKRLKSIRTLSSKENEILHDKTIFNVFSYDLLMDTKYIDMYQYVPFIYRDINQLNKQEYTDSDYVRKCVDLAYWYDQKIDKLNLDLDHRATVYRRFDYYTKRLSSLSSRPDRMKR